MNRLSEWRRYSVLLRRLPRHLMLWMAGSFRARDDALCL